jgi:hypothetical protein
MAIQIRSNFSQFFGSTKLPELEAIILSIAEDWPSMIPLLFNVESMASDIYQTTTYSGLRNPQAKNEGGPVQFQDMNQGFAKTYSANHYTNGYRISYEMVKDGKWNMIERATRSFAKGHAEVEEILAADVFDNGFTTNGYDGVPLFSASHPLENGDGAVGSNISSTGSALSVTSFRELRNVLQDTVNENGQRVRYMPKWFVVPQALQDTAMEIVKSQYNPENANNAVNTVYDTVSLLPTNFWNYLDSDTAFFLGTDSSDHGLMFMNRQALETDSDYDPFVAYEVMSSRRFDVGYSQWRGWVGNAGV